MVILQVTYDLYPQQIVGGPAWLNTERFDITAKAEERVSEAQTIEMVKSLLADRFGLKSHVEQKRLPVIAVVLARTDGRLGPGLRRPAVDCGNGSDPRPPTSRPRTSDPSGSPFPCGGARMTVVDGVRRLRLNGQPLINVFAVSGARAGLGRPLVDRTGLTGIFDIAVDWEIPAEALPRDGGDALSAIQDQLGLKLVRRDEMLDVLVIDAVERPEFD